MTDEHIPARVRSVLRTIGARGGLPRPEALEPRPELPLPGHVRLRFEPGVFADAATLIGGAPLRVLRLRPKARTVVAALADGSALDDLPKGEVSFRAASRLARRLIDAGFAQPCWPQGRPRTFSPGDLTAVVPVKDRAARMQPLVASLAPMPVVVVDDGSTDGSAEVARAAGAEVVRRERSGGPAAARNVGAATVATPLIAFLDSDCSVEEGWFEPLIAHFDDPAVALVAPRIVSPNFRPGRTAYDPPPHFRPGRTAYGFPGRPRRPVLRYEDVRSPLDLGPAAAAIRPTGPVPYVPAAALLVRADAFRAVGGFAEDLDVGEDVDLVWRLHEAGYSLRYEPTATVAHAHRDRLRDLLARRIDYGSSAAELAIRHPGQVPPAALSVWSLLAWSAASTLTPAGLVIAASTAAASGLALRRKLDSIADATGRSWSIVAKGNLAAGRQLAEAIWRAWLPLALPIAASRRGRILLFASAVLPALSEWRRRAPDLDPVRYSALRVADNAAYCVGVWRGCVARRTVAPLVPRVSDLPMRRRSLER